MTKASGRLAIAAMRARQHNGDHEDTNAQPRPVFTLLSAWRGAVRILPLAAFVIPFGIAFGAAATAKSIPSSIAIFMSAAMFAGASQFAILGQWAAPLPLLTLVLIVLAVNARHVLLGAALAPWLLEVPILGRLAALAVLSDANFAQTMTARQHGELDAGTLFGGGCVLWLVWIVGTAIGSLGGSFLGDTARYGFDAVMITYFTAVVVGQWKGTADLVPWVSAAAVAVACAFVLPAGWHIIAGALTGGLIGTVRSGKGG